MLWYVSSHFLKKYCNKDCNWEGEPNGTPFFDLERRRLPDILVATFNLDWYPETFAAAELYLFDRQLMIVLDVGIWTMDIEELYFKWTYTYIYVGDIGHIFRKWLLFLKPDIIITVPEGRCCCSVPDIEYYCWVAEVIYSSWVPDQILFQTRWCQTFGQDTDAEYLAYYY